MEEGINFAEYAVSRKPEGKNRLARVLLVLGYIAFAIGYSAFFIAVHVPQLIAILPILVWMSVFFTWRYVSYDYVYRVSQGYFYIIRRAARKEKQLVCLHVKEALEIAPVTTVMEGALDFRGDTKNGDGYYVRYSEAGGERCACFEATRALVKILHRQNEKTVVSEDLRY